MSTRIDDRNENTRVRQLWIDGVIALVAVSPLLLTAHLPLSDLPNHLARQFILRDLSQSPILQQFYNVHWQLVPNLALEIFVTLARNVMTIDGAVRAFCISTILLMYFGGRLINRALGGPHSHIYRIAPFLFYGGPFQFGFLSYCFGVGLALLFTGLYLRLRSVSTLRLMAIFVPCTFAILLCHLAAFGIFCIAVCGVELGSPPEDEKMRTRVNDILVRQARVFAFLVPTFLVFRFFSPTSGAGSGMVFSTLQQKVESVAAITLFSSPLPELLILVFAVVGLGAALICRVVRLPAAGAIVAAGFFIVWILLPRSAMGGGYVDYRLPWAASLFFLSSLVPGTQYERLGSLFGRLFGALALTRIIVISWLWLMWEPTLAAIDDAVSKLPLGARVMVVRSEPSSTSLSRQPSLEHVAAYAVARRQAFETNIYSGVSGQILSLKEPYKHDWMLVPPKNLSRLGADYSHVIVLWPQFAEVSRDLPLQCLASGRNFELLKVVSGDGATAHETPGNGCRHGLNAPSP